MIEIGGRTSQDLGAGRIVGQVLVYLYLQEHEQSLDQIASDLGLSKASVSIAARQLDSLGLIKKVWKSGDRRNYYKSAENIGTALQQGLLSFVQQKVQLFGLELDDTLSLIESHDSGNSSCDADFLHQRVSRAKALQSKLDKILGNPMVKFLAGAVGGKQ
ncbi:GbsR/MarR family transcriptional regulator [Desulfogranum mediterraneum]|uniref:GbsR/MarR family transcriptional regulator n=1 Tax=Desulfogranum mediterraneum TaxID=160661 RepID=UPI00129470A6|nr:hypothetical protein [Desulfogranum mediterraneum]